MGGVGETLAGEPGFHRTRRGLRSSMFSTTCCPEMMISLEHYKVTASVQQVMDNPLRPLVRRASSARVMEQQVHLAVAVS